MNPVETHRHRQHFLYDGDLLADIRSEDFEANILAAKGQVHGTAHGRGTTHFIALQGHACVLRHYRRGGWARLLGDRYARCKLSQTRAWREWHLLSDLTAKGLPVPGPVAARVRMQGLFYRADLITRRLPKTASLSLVLRDSPLPGQQWREIGAVLRRFHNAGVCHADLNAHNILLDNHQAVYLIDFDRGEIRTPARPWQMDNLARLQRSLNKLLAQQQGFHFSDTDWGQLMEGWQSGA